MPRTPRCQQWTDEAAYHVFSRGHNRETVFADADDGRFFLGLLDRYRQRTGFRLYHYCLLTNHFHLLLQVETPRQLSSLLAGLLRAYVHYFNRRHGFVGHLWQGRFRSPAVQTEGYLLSCGRYIERNPVAAGLVAEPWQYTWSSARCYALGVPDGLLAPNPWYEALAATATARQEHWRRFLLGDDPREAAVLQADWVIGNDAFRQRMRQLQGRPARRRRGRPRKSPAPAQVFWSEPLNQEERA